MVRCVVLAAILLGSVETAGATTVVQKDLSRTELAAARPAIPLSTPSSAVPDGQFQLTAETEVLLNGKSCSYKDVPKEASIARIELGQDRKTVLRIEFLHQK